MRKSNNAKAARESKGAKPSFEAFYNNNLPADKKNVSGKSLKAPTSVASVGKMSTSMKKPRQPRGSIGGGVKQLPTVGRTEEAAQESSRARNQ